MKTIFCFFLIFLPTLILAQCNQYNGCKDSTRTPDQYHIISTDYIPVCGCDGKTYRNCDAAYWWGGINQWDGNGPCESFDIDLYPNPVGEVPANLYIYMKNAGSATLQVYTSYGMLVLEQIFNNSSTIPGIISEANPYDLNMKDFKNGIYILIVYVGGDKKSKKFLCLTH